MRPPGKHHSLIFALLALMVGQWLYSNRFDYSQPGLYLPTNPSGAEVSKRQAELFVSTSAQVSGGQSEAILGTTPGPIQLSPEELPLSLTFRAPGFEPLQRTIQAQDFGPERIHRQRFQLQPESLLGRLRGWWREYPFLALALPVFLGLLLNWRGRKLQAALDASDRAGVTRGVIRSGMKIGEYAVKGKLGSGGMAQVFEVHKSDGTEPRALKLMDETANSIGGRQKFLEEVKATAKLQHPGLPFVYDWGEFAGRFYLVTDLVEGETLRERLKRGTMSPSEVRELGRELCLALGAIHQAGLVHRDVKPSNIFLTSKGRVKLMDLGVAAAAGDLGRRFGTAAYAPPEQLAGEAVDPRSDIYSLGVTLLEALSPGQDPQLEADLSILTATEPEQRPESIAKVLQQLTIS